MEHVQQISKSVLNQTQRKMILGLIHHWCHHR